MDSEVGAYRIGTVARLVGVEVATLRNWEQRYGVVVARRGPGRQRLYSTADVDRLHVVKQWIDGGLSAGEAHVLLREQPRVLRADWDTLDRGRVRADARRLRAEAVSTHARAAAARAVAHEQLIQLLERRERLQA